MIHFSLSFLLLCGVCYTGFQGKTNIIPKTLPGSSGCVSGALPLQNRSLLTTTPVSAMILPVLLRGLTGSSP